MTERMTVFEPGDRLATMDEGGRVRVWTISRYGDHLANAPDPEALSADPIVKVIADFPDGSHRPVNLALSRDHRVYWAEGPGADREAFKRDLAEQQRRQTPGPMLEDQQPDVIPPYMTDPVGPGHFVTLFGRRVEVRVENGVGWVRHASGPASYGSHERGWSLWSRMERP